MKNVLCYGDSNTHGYDGVTVGRFPWGVRWTSLVQEALKEEQVRIIEEGQNGRTTVWDDPIEGMKSGREIPDSLSGSHSPLDVVVLMLGTNGYKTAVFPVCVRCGGRSRDFGEDHKDVFPGEPGAGAGDPAGISS